MRLLRTGLCLALLLLLAVPARVEARAKDDGWWGWLERLSGPGPFWGDPALKMAFELDRLVCRSQSGETGSAFSPRNFAGWKAGTRALQGDVPCGAFDRPKWFVGFNVSTLTNRGSEQYPDRWGNTDLARSLFIVYVRMKSPILHVGAGAGVYHFNGRGVGSREGESYSTNLAAVPVRVRVTPFASLAQSDREIPRFWRNVLRSVYVEGGGDYLPGPIDADNFKSDYDYAKRNDWAWTARAVINVPTLIGF